VKVEERPDCEKEETELGLEPRALFDCELLPGSILFLILIFRLTRDKE